MYGMERVSYEEVDLSDEHEFGSYEEEKGSPTAPPNTATVTYSEMEESEEEAPPISGGYCEADLDDRKPSIQHTEAETTSYCELELDLSDALASPLTYVVTATLCVLDDDDDDAAVISNESSSGMHLELRRWLASDNGTSE